MIVAPRRCSSLPHMPYDLQRNLVGDAHHRPQRPVVPHRFHGVKRGRGSAGGDVLADAVTADVEAGEARTFHLSRGGAVVHVRATAVMPNAGPSLRQVLAPNVLHGSQRTRQAGTRPLLADSETIFGVSRPYVV
jgi:hypothetical protein